MIKINNNKKTLSVEVDFKDWLNTRPKVTRSTRLYGKYMGFPYGVYDDDDYPDLESLQTFWDDVDDFPQDDYPLEEDDYPIDTDSYSPTLRELTERYGGKCIDVPSRRKKHSHKKKIKKIGVNSPMVKTKKTARLKKRGCYLDYMPNPTDTYSKLNEERVIYFYSDVADQESWTKFNSAYELDTFLSENKIDLPNSSIVKLFDNFESHCCLDPRSIESGFIELAVAESYGHLRWECDPSISESSDNDQLPF